MTYKRGPVNLLIFSFEQDAHNIINCAPKILICAPTIWAVQTFTSGGTSAPKLKFNL